MKPKPGSWFSLLVFCLTSCLIAALIAAFVLAGATLAFAGHGPQEQAEPQNFAGVISDSNCGARHMRNSDLSPAECVRMCVGRGAQYVLVDGDKVYTLAGKHRILDQLAGQRVKLTGIADGDTIRVSQVTALSEPD